MMSLLVQWLGDYGNAIKTNPVLAMFAVYFTGVATYLLRNIPKAIYQFIVNQTTTVLELDNTVVEGNSYQYNNFINWYGKSKWFKHSRIIFLGGMNSQPNTISFEFHSIKGPGNGLHFFFHKRKLFWFMIADLASTGSEHQKKSIRIRCLGRSHTPMMDLVSMFEYVPESSKIAIHYWDNYYKQWRRSNAVVNRHLDTVILDEKIKKDLIKNLDWFTQNKAWYESKLRDYKQTFLFHGPSGTGKTSLAKAIACTYKRNLYVLDLSTLDNDTLRIAVAAIPKGSCMLVEDIDASTKAVMKRTDENSAPQESIADESGFGKLTLSGVLNTLDGAVALNDIILTITTNHSDRLDPALVRKSRIDHTYLIGLMTYIEIRQYYEMMYPDYKDLSILFTKDNCSPIPGCDVQAAFTDNPFDPNGFYNAIVNEQVEVTQLKEVA